MRLHFGTVAAVLAVLVLVFGGCASSKSHPASGSKAGKGFRVLDAVVVERIYEPPGSPGTSFASSGSYYLEFEARDGDAVAHYRFPVTHSQYNRYSEGTHVQLVMADNRLREIRPAP